MQSEFTFEASGYRCVAVRSDRPWGHGLKVNIFCDQGRLLNVISFACHPEFPEYEILQAKNTEQLVELAASQLRTGELENNLLEVRKDNLPLFVRFKVISK
jgi:hypothetical protein